jgi:hypothetical protein
VLLLKENKLYVGYTLDNDKERVCEHLKRNLASWTKNYNPIGIINILEKVDEIVEGWVAGYLMIKNGYNNVRGWGFTQNKDYDKPPEYLKTIPIMCV